MASAMGAWQDKAQELAILELGQISYAEALAFQKERHARVLSGEVAPTLLLLEHKPVITLGRGATQETMHEHVHVSEAFLREKGIDVFWVERGGMATYHGPGQLVAYPILPLVDKDLHVYLEKLLNVVAQTLEHFGLAVELGVHGPGVWVNGKKIASVGMAVRKWVTYHGIALNVNTDLTPFGLIAPCGNPSEKITSMQQELGHSLDLQTVQELFVAKFLHIFGFTPQEQPGRRPAWLTLRTPPESATKPVQNTLDDLHLHTVCQEAHCPNRRECFARGTSTFIIMGETCTRNCHYCAVHKGKPSALDPLEPVSVARAVAHLGITHAVITSVTRDDLADGGAGHFVATIEALRRHAPQSTVEVLVPDFQGKWDAIERVYQARPDMFNHNIEAVRRIFTKVRPRADYDLSLKILERAASQGLAVKSGLMLGLGETWSEIRTTLEELYAHGCRYVTIGQYLSPSHKHVPIARYIAPDEFAHWAEVAKAIGFWGVASAPLVRSSYRAEAMLRSDHHPLSSARCADAS